MVMETQKKVNGGHDEVHGSVIGFVMRLRSDDAGGFLAWNFCDLATTNLLFNQTVNHQHYTKEMRSN
jgi:hypothetical protein